MRSKEALLKNFFCNVEVVLRTQKVAATSQRWEVRPPGGCSAASAPCGTLATTARKTGQLRAFWHGAEAPPDSCPLLGRRDGEHRMFFSFNNSLISSSCFQKQCYCAQLPAPRVPTRASSACSVTWRLLRVPVQEEEKKLQQELDAAQRRVHEALCDNINTQACGPLHPNHCLLCHPCQWAGRHPSLIGCK